MKSIIYAALFIAILSNCSKKESCPPDVILGSLALNSASKEFLPYGNIRFVEFVDSAALDTAVLYSFNGLIHDTSRTVIENICLIDEERADRYFNSEHLTVDYFDLDTSRKFRIIGNVSINEDFRSKSSTLQNPVLYDELKLTVHRTNPSISSGVATLEFVAHDRGNLNILSDTLRSRIQRYSLVPEVTIHDSVYKDVFVFKYRDTAVFYFKPNQGLVAFRDINSKWWNLHKKY
ncbi:MAG: hypothetical protein IPO78_12300 [Saprospiraceae bacterium]|nr:hypothetical protein [Saprospiraceae bacterium]MBK9722379.1 hypothetical protein [Saprospiraceae bacterium]